MLGRLRHRLFGHRMRDYEYFLLADVYRCRYCGQRITAAALKDAAARLGIMEGPGQAYRDAARNMGLKP